MRGARHGTMNALQRIAAAAMSRDLCGFVVPGAEIARTVGIDLGDAGLRLSATPRHANVLVVIGRLPAGLLDAACVVYAQMPRPRAILTLGTNDISPLPVPDATGPLTQAGLEAAIADIRRIFAMAAFQPDVENFEAPTLETSTEYTCPMHPEVVQEAPGNCPKCGMTLVERETAGSVHRGHAVPEQKREVAAQKHSKPVAVCHDRSKGGHSADGDNHEQHKTHGSGHKQHHMRAKPDNTEAPLQYTCPMHPEVVSDEAGSCPKCGMHLVPVAEAGGHSGHDHKAHGKAHDEHSTDNHRGGHGGHGGSERVEGVEAHFMSMVDLTRDMPASADGLKMEWIDVPFGPFFPGLPGGLQLKLTLDGDAVATTSADSLVGSSDPLRANPSSPIEFVDHLAALSPLSPIAYRLLACLALEQAAGQSVAPDIARARLAVVERERVASHLGWLAVFGAQSGSSWIEKRAAAFQLKVQGAAATDVTTLKPKLSTFLAKLQRTPLLAARLSGIGQLPANDTLSGPVARASGMASDTRSDDPVYAEIGFSVLTMTDGDALARLVQRCNEITQSLDLISAVGSVARLEPHSIGAASGTGEAVVETPRGAARLSLTLHKGKVIAADIKTPTTAHLTLIGDVAEGQELGDALTGIGSLDISPWEVTS